MKHEALPTLFFVSPGTVVTDRAALFSDAPVIGHCSSMYGTSSCGDAIIRAVRLVRTK